MTLTHWLRKFSYAVLSCGAIALSAQAQENASQAYDLEIDALPLMAAVKTLSDETGIEVLYFSEVAEGVTSSPVKGEYTPTEALETMLASTDLEVVDLDQDGAVAIRPTKEAVVPGKAQPASSQVLMAQNQTPAQRTQTTSPSATTNEEPAKKDIEEIIVVGSQIRGAGAAGANVITIDREAIELSGLATTQEILQTVPQNFGDGANEANATVGLGSGSQNFGYSSSVNLRGLGTSSTLLLLNGRRSAPGGGDGDFVDLNSIPATAIERVEVLADGASATYGSDAIGGVVNVILRDDYEGAETRIRYAPGTSDIDEIQFSQVFGKSWDTGNVLFTYEFYDRGELKSADRNYTNDSDLTRLGGSNRSTDRSNPGNIDRYRSAAGSNVTVQLAIPGGQDGTALSAADLIPGVSNIQNTREGTTVLPSQKRNSVFVSASQELTDKIDLFADARYSTREFETFSMLSTSTRITVPNTNPFFVDLDPLGGAQNVRVRYSNVDDYGAPRVMGDVDSVGGTLGATFSLSNSWELEAYGSINTEKTFSRNDRAPNTALQALALADPDPLTAFNPFGDGSFTNPATLAAIEGFRETDIESELLVFNVRADGDLFDMPGGAAKLAIGAQFRNESLLFDQLRFTNTPTPVPSTSNFNLDRDITAAFVELYFPFVTGQNSRPGINKLAVSIAGRYEDYSDFGDTFDPKLGVSWSPVESLNIRGTIGTSFRAPLLTELNDQDRNILAIEGLIAFGSPPPFDSAIFILGNSPGITPQEGTTWTTGFDVTPVSLPGLKVSVTYFDTEVDDLIANPGANILIPLLDLEAFGPIVTICPCDAEATVLFNDPAFGGTPTPLDELDAIVDVRLGNIASAALSGLDLEVSYAFETGAGAFNLSFYASHLFEFEEQFSPNGPFIDNVDTIAKPNSLKMRGGLSWSNGVLNAAIFGNHVGDYTDNFSNPERRVSSWTAWDLYLGYNFGEGASGFLNGSKVSVNVRNVFDRDPPFVDGFNGVGFDSINADPFGQYATIQLIKEW